MPDGPCGHLRAIDGVKHPMKYQCIECMKIGSGWVHLRTCQECGATHCCDESPNRHARRHAFDAHHPVVASAEPGERWLYCFADDEAVDY